MKKLNKTLVVVGLIGAFVIGRNLTHFKPSSPPPNMKVHQTNVFQEEIKKASKIVTYDGTFRLVDNYTKDDWLKKIAPKSIELELTYNISYFYNTNNIKVESELSNGQLEISIDPYRMELSPIALDMNKSTMNHSQSILSRNYKSDEIAAILREEQNKALEQIKANDEFKERALDNLEKILTDTGRKFGYDKVKITYHKSLLSSLKDSFKPKYAIASPQKIKTIAIDIGHNANHDSGAVSNNIKEDTLTKEVGMKVIWMLQNSGYNVVDISPNNASSTNDSLRQRVSKANSKNVDLFLSIHFNKSDNPTSKGTEIWIPDNRSRSIANSILKEFASSGYFNRGVKTTQKLYVLRKSNAPSMLVECGFINSDEDMSRYNSNAIAFNIVKAIEKF